MNTVLFVTLPKIEIFMTGSTDRWMSVPLWAGIFAGIALKNNWEPTHCDMNFDLYSKFKDDPTFDEIWLDFSEEHEISDTAESNLIGYFIAELEEIKKHKYDMICVSVFSGQSMPYYRMFLELLNRAETGAKIIVGGGGLTQPEELREYFDHYVQGEGELSFEKVLLNDLPFAGVDSKQTAMIDMKDLPLPNFDGIDLSTYPRNNPNKIMIAIETSRGCVRNCSFCDVRAMYPKYRTKTGQQIMDEIKFLADTYNVRDFTFNDSLINGSLKQFREFIRLLAEYNLSQSEEERIVWTSNFIIRPIHQTQETDYEHMRDSGCYTLGVGLESTSDSVREHMGKKFTEADVEHFIKMCSKYDLKIFLLMLVGYPTETKEDFATFDQFFKKYEKYGREFTITGINLGDTLGFNEGAPLWRQLPELKVTTPEGRGLRYWSNDLVSFKERIRRRISAERSARKYGFVSQKSIDNFRLLLHLAQDLRDEN